MVIGVHSPKFPHEADHAAVARAVRRHRIGHPVLDDPDLETWQLYGVRAWPTLVVIDPDGYVVAMASGERNGPALEKVVAQLIEGRADLAAGRAFTPVPVRDTGTLAFPGKVCSDGGIRIAIADTGNDRVLVCNLDGTIRHELRDFHQPQGVRFDGESPPGLRHGPRRAGCRRSSRRRTAGARLGPALTLGRVRASRLQDRGRRGRSPSNRRDSSQRW